VLLFGIYEVVLHVHVRSSHLLIFNSLNITLIHEPLDSIINILDILFNIDKETVELELYLVQHNEYDYHHFWKDVFNDS